MARTRRARARFTGAEAARTADSFGVVLGFRPEYKRLGVDLLEHYAVLGPEDSVPAVAGVGNVLRVLRAARIAVPDDPRALAVGDTAETLLDRAIGTRLALELAPRTRVVFEAWTEAGVERIEDVDEVIEVPDAWLVKRRGARFSSRIPRRDVIRQHTDCIQWFEVVGIARP